jgi:hypothetical protein
MLAVGPSDIVEMAAIAFALVGFAIVIVPLCRAFVSAVEFANYPAHRVTPTESWTFFDQEFQRRFRRWVVVWVLVFPVNVAAIATLEHHLRGLSLKTSCWIGMECGFFTLAPVFFGMAVVAIVGPRIPRLYWLMGAAAILTAAVYVVTIWLTEFPPPSSAWNHRDFAVLNYVQLSIFALMLAICAWAFFYARRKNLSLFSGDV